jgi:protein-S-isoprenylcysteine O-methyltransferase Ste14
MSPYHMGPHQAAMTVWFVWVVSWLLAAAWSRQTAKGAGFAAQLPYRIVTLVGGVLLFGIYPESQNGPGQLWTLDSDAKWALVGVVVLGLAFTWWARLHLGALWSGFVMKKEGHHVVDTGPYAIVRHPIYTGLILSAFATAVQIGTAAAVLGAAIMTIGFWMKARLEERFLRAELGPDAYDSYRRRVPMLVPFGPKSA